MFLGEDHRICMLNKHYGVSLTLLCVSGTLVARSGDLVLYQVGVGSDLPHRESPTQTGRVGNYVCFTLI